MIIGIIGHGADKFTDLTEVRAKGLITELLTMNQDPLRLDFVSGHSPMGGIDIWAEEIADDLDYVLNLKIAKQHKWDAKYDYKQRNLDIARDCDILHIILVDKYPEGYKGRRFSRCYHCNSVEHIKSGACWTGKIALRLGKKVVWHIIKGN